MDNDLFECNDCGSMGEVHPKTNEKPFHTCKNCGSGFVSRMDPAGDFERTSRAISSMRSRGFNLNDISVNESGSPEVRLRHGDWIGRYSGGNIDIAHASDPSRAVDSINLMNYGSGQHQQLTSRQLHRHLEDWANEVGEDTFRNL